MTHSDEDEGVSCAASRKLEMQEEGLQVRNPSSQSGDKTENSTTSDAKFEVNGIFTTMGLSKNEAAVEEGSDVDGKSVIDYNSKQQASSSVAANVSSLGVDKNSVQSKDVSDTDISEHPNSNARDVFRNPRFGDIFSTNDSDSDVDGEPNHDESPAEEVSDEVNRSSEIKDDDETMEKTYGEECKKHTRKSTKQRKTSKARNSKDSLKELYSESQRLIRQSSAKLPYHMPQRVSLKEFLERRRKSKSAILSLSPSTNSRDGLEATGCTNIELPDIPLGKSTDSSDIQVMKQNPNSNTHVNNIQLNIQTTSEDDENIKHPECNTTILSQPSSVNSPSITLTSSAHNQGGDVNQTPKPPTRLSEIKKLALEAAKKCMPKPYVPLSLTEFDITPETPKQSNEDNLIERFIKHSVGRPKNIESRQVHLHIIKKEPAENNTFELKKEEIIVDVGEANNVEVEKIPGQTILKLKQKLMRSISKKEQESWENRLLTHKLDNEEDCEDDADDVEEEEEEELMTDSSTEEEDEEEEEDFVITKKQKPRCAFVDDEAEEEGDINNESDDDDEGSDYGELDVDDNRGIKTKKELVSLHSDNHSRQKTSKTFDELLDDCHDYRNAFESLVSFGKMQENEMLPSTLTPKTPDISQSAGTSKCELTPSNGSIKDSHLASTFKTPEISLLGSGGSLGNVTPTLIGSKNVSQAFATQNLYLSPTDEVGCDIINKSFDTAAEERPKTAPIAKATQQNSKPRASLNLIESQSESSQDNIKELLDLCSGKFDNTLPDVNKDLYDDKGCTQQRMGELLDLCSGKFTGCAQQTDEHEGGGESSAQNIEKEESDNLQKGNEDPNGIDVGPAVFSKRKKVGGRRILFISSDDDTDADDDKETGHFIDDDFLDVNSPGGDDDEVDSNSNNKAGDVHSENKSKFHNEFFEVEAELSGSDVGSDEDDEGSDEEEDDLELEVPDEDLPSEEELRNQIGRVHLKTLLDEDQRKVKLYQEMYLEDGDLHDEGGERERKFRWSNSQDLEDHAQNQSDEEGSEHEDEHDYAKWRVLRHERQQWLEESGIDPENLLSPGKKFKSVRNFKRPFSDTFSSDNSKPHRLTKSIMPTTTMLKGSFLKRSGELEKHMQKKFCMPNADGARSTKSVCFRIKSPEPRDKQEADLLKCEKPEDLKSSSKRIKLMPKTNGYLPSNRNSHSIFDLF